MLTDEIIGSRNDFLFFSDRDKANTDTADGYDSLGAGDLIYGVEETRGEL